MEAKTMTLAESLSMAAFELACSDDPGDARMKVLMDNAASALEAAQKALEPFAEKANWMDDLLGRVTTGDFDPTVATVSVSDLRLARTVYSMLIGEDETKGDIKEANHEG